MPDEQGFFFFFSILWTGYHPPEDFPKFGYRSERKADKFCSILWTGYHPQEDFPKFGYRSERKVNKIWNPVIFWWHARPYCLDLAICFWNSFKIWLQPLFPKKTSFVWVTCPFFWLPSGKEDAPPKRQFCYWWAKNGFFFWKFKFEIDATRNIN